MMDPAVSDDLQSGMASTMVTSGTMTHRINQLEKAGRTTTKAEIVTDAKDVSIARQFD